MALSLSTVSVFLPLSLFLCPSQVTYFVDSLEEMERIEEDDDDDDTSAKVD